MVNATGPREPEQAPGKKQMGHLRGERWPKRRLNDGASASRSTVASGLEPMAPQWQLLGPMAEMVSPCRAFGVSETCYRYSPKLKAENEVIADLLTGLTDA